MSGLKKSWRLVALELNGSKESKTSQLIEVTASHVFVIGWVFHGR